MKTTQQLEAKIAQLSQHLEQQAQLHKSAMERARKAEQEAEGMRLQMKGIEGELVATDLLRDGLKTDKKKVKIFCFINCANRFNSEIDRFSLELLRYDF